jgi:hypothetical protein
MSRWVPATAAGLTASLLCRRQSSLGGLAAVAVPTVVITHAHRQSESGSELPLCAGLQGLHEDCQAAIRQLLSPLYKVGLNQPKGGCSLVLPDSGVSEALFFLQTL